MTEWEEIDMNRHIMRLVIIGVLRAGGPKTTEELWDYLRELKRALKLSYFYGCIEEFKIHDVIQSDTFLERVGTELKNKNEKIKDLQIEIENYNHFVLQKERENALYLQRNR